MEPFFSDFPPFPGFRPEAFQFLRDLAANNDRDWFTPRKHVYKDEVEWPLQCLVADASAQARALGLPLWGDPKKALFRIYRDTRFSGNKAPYKSNAGAVLTRSGGKNDPGVLYIHIEPDAGFLGAGYWRPENDLLRPWRARLADDPDAFLELVEGLHARGLTLSHGDPLKRMPRGFEHLADHPIAPHLRARSFVASRSFPDEALQHPGFTQEVVQMMRDSLPLLEYGWEMMER